jgi:hypothetical protein
MKTKKLTFQEIIRELKNANISLNSEKEYVRWEDDKGRTNYDSIEMYRKFCGGSIDVNDLTFIIPSKVRYTYNNATAKEIANQIIKMIEDVRLIEDRISVLGEYEIIHHFEEFFMGSGGVGQYKQMQDGTLRIQIGYGKGKNNKAMCAVILPDTINYK